VQYRKPILIAEGIESPEHAMLAYRTFEKAGLEMWYQWKEDEPKALVA
jgi:hypothetical protein